MKHFKLTSTTKTNIFGIKLFQLELAIDCKWGKAGTKGGWVEKESNVQIEDPEHGNVSGGEIWGDAVIRGGEIRGGEIWGGVIWGGVIRGGVIRGGVIRGGVIWGGVIWGDAVIRGGVIRGGVIWGDAVIRGGVIRGGEIWGGVIWGGVIRGGEIWGGVIWGGVIWGGEIRGGDWKKAPLQIQGTRHFVNMSAKGKLKIGCKEFEISFWLEKFKEIGKSEGYTAEEIKEYELYIKLAAKLYGNDKAE